MTLRFSSPLSWPEWIPVTSRVNQRTDRNFAPAMKLEESIAFLEEEIQAINCNAILSLDIEQPTSERNRKKVGSRTGAALQLRFPFGNYVLACDTWLTMENNIYALHLAMRQWRNMERWGVGTLPVLLKGFEPGVQTVVSSQAPEWNMPDWMEYFGLGPTATLEDAQAIYHKRAKQFTQDTNALTKLNVTMEEARAHFSKRT
ncbi:MAG: hypothetical protein ACK502_05880 [Alphaproteobacteria bacterium]